MIVKRKIRCCWTNLEERQRNPRARIRHCRRIATWLSCQPREKTPTCRDHKCYCATPFRVDDGDYDHHDRQSIPEVQAVGRVFLEDLRTAVNRRLTPGQRHNPYHHVSITGCQHHADAGVVVCFYPMQGDLAFFCRSCDPEGPPLMIVPMSLRPN